MRPRSFLPLLVALLPGCSSLPAQDEGPPSDPGLPAAAESLRLVAGEPVQVNPDGHGFEPSIRVAPDGSLYVAAASGFVPRGDGTLASPVWASRDGGLAWEELSAPAGVRGRLETQEGDLAVDGDGTVYFLDTFGADTILTVWEADGTWRSTNPVATEGADDRPWLAAHSGGTVHMLENSLVKLPLRQDLLDAVDGSVSGGAIGYYRSTDGGLTWDTGFALPGSSPSCAIAADAAGDSLAVLCLRGPQAGLGATPSDVAVFASRDRGATWTVSSIAGFEAPSAGFPSIALDAAGGAYGAWATDGTIHVARAPGLDGPWDVLDLEVPSVQNAWLAAGPAGTVAVAYERQDEGGWFLEAQWTGDALAPEPGWVAARLDPEPVGGRDRAPVDFFQCAMGPDGTLHVAYHREAVPPTPTPKPWQGQVLYVQAQAA